MQRRRGGQVFCDYRALGLGHNCVTREGRGWVKYCANLREVIHECPQRRGQQFGIVRLTTADALPDVRTLVTFEHRSRTSIENVILTTFNS